jgi:hypothetical protein
MRTGACSAPASASNGMAASAIADLLTSGPAALEAVSRFGWDRIVDFVLE